MELSELDRDRAVRAVQQSYNKLSFTMELSELDRDRAVRAVQQSYNKLSFTMELVIINQLFPNINLIIKYRRRNMI